MLSTLRPTASAAGETGATRRNLASPAESTFTVTLKVFEKSTVPSVSLATLTANVPDSILVAPLNVNDGVTVTM